MCSSDLQGKDGRRERRKGRGGRGEEAELKKEDDRLSRERLDHLRKELAEEREIFSGMKAQWENEKASVEEISAIREEIEDMGRKIQMAQRNYDLEKAAELQYGKLPELKKHLAELESGIKKKRCVCVSCCMLQ